MWASGVRSGGVRLGGKVALVTGGTRGIGAAVVALFSREGAKVTFCGRNESLGQALETELRREGREVAFLSCDVTDEAAVRSLVDATVERSGRLDIVVNSAGVAPSSRVEDTTLAAWQQVLDVNVSGMFLVTRQSIPHLRRSGGGAIVNVGSTYGVVGAAGSAAYALSKAAAISFSKSLALELAPDRIRVNALCPGATATPLNEEWLQAQADPEEALRLLVQRHPMGRLATAMEQAHGALYLVSDEASFVTGHALLVDGGYTAI